MKTLIILLLFYSCGKIIVSDDPSTKSLLPILQGTWIACYNNMSDSG